MIFCYVSDAESIVYVPRDRRKKVDHAYNEFRHFHDLLTISKNFVTTNEFTFAILRSARLTFYSVNELRRLSAEVSPVFKTSIRQIQFHRSLHTGHDVRPRRAQFEDVFDSAGNIDKYMLDMPELRQICINLDDYCAEIGHFKVLTSSDPPSYAQEEEMLHDVLSNKDSVPPYLISHSDRLPTVVASVIGDRTHEVYNLYPWTKPHNWIRRLVQWAEQANIEVIFKVNLCISSDITTSPGEHIPLTIYQGQINHPYVYQWSFWNTEYENIPCWSNRSWCTSPKEYRAMHFEATMSTKNYLLEIEFGGKKYKYHQKLAYEMLHAKAGKSNKWWCDFLAQKGYAARGRTPYYSF